MAKSKLSDEEKVKILTEDFIKFNKEEKEKLGLFVGVRLHTTQNSIEAILVPIKVAQEQEQEQEHEEEKE